MEVLKMEVLNFLDFKDQQQNKTTKLTTRRAEMRRLLALVALVGFLPQANAEKGEFEHDAEYRARYTYHNNQGGSDKSAPNNDSDIKHRFKLGSTFKASDSFSARLALLHNADWGSVGNSETTATPASNAATNLVLVNEAFGLWNVSNEFALKLGRQNITIADGTVFHVNDYEATPYAFDGILGTYDFEFGSLSGFVLKFADYAHNTNGTTQDDPEHNAYGLSFDLKAGPEWLKWLNVHLIKNSRAARPTGLTFPDNMGQDIIRWGLTAKAEMSGADLRLVYAGTSGDYKCLGTAGTCTGNSDRQKIDAAGWMYMAEIGYTIEAFMNTRIYGIYHSDSGDKSDTDKKYAVYDSYFYDLHYNAGLMDIVKWGNLTYFTIGMDMTPTDDMKVGLQYHNFMRTEKNGDSFAGKNGGRLITAANSNATPKAAIGQEIDLYAEQKYESGFSILGRLGYFMPGELIEKSATPKLSDNYFQAFVQAKMSF